MPVMKKHAASEQPQSPRSFAQNRRSQSIAAEALSTPQKAAVNNAASMRASESRAANVATMSPALVAAIAMELRAIDSEMGKSSTTITFDATKPLGFGVGNLSGGKHGIGAVLSGSQAQLLGMHEGDVVLSIGGDTLQGVHDKQSICNHLRQAIVRAKASRPQTLDIVLESGHHNLSLLSPYSGSLGADGSGRERLGNAVASTTESEEPTPLIVMTSAGPGTVVGTSAGHVTVVLVADGVTKLTVEESSVSLVSSGAFAARRFARDAEYTPASQLSLRALAYGQVAATSASTSASFSVSALRPVTTASSYREQLIYIFTLKAPERMHTVGAMLGRNAGGEEVFLRALRQQYGLPPLPRDHFTHRAPESKYVLSEYNAGAPASAPASAPSSRPRLLAESHNFVEVLALRSRQLGSTVKAYSELAVALERESWQDSAELLNFPTFLSRTSEYVVSIIGSAEKRHLHRATLRAIFDAIDVDRNGKLSFPELKCGLVTLFHLNATDAANLLFEACDVHGTTYEGFLDESEFAMAFCSVISVHALFKPDAVGAHDVREIAQAQASVMFKAARRRSRFRGVTGLTKAQFCAWFIAYFGASEEEERTRRRKEDAARRRKDAKQAARRRKDNELARQQQLEELTAARFAEQQELAFRMAARMVGAGTRNRFMRWKGWFMARVRRRCVDAGGAAVEAARSYAAAAMEWASEAAGEVPYARELAAGTHQRARDCAVNNGVLAAVTSALAADIRARAAAEAVAALKDEWAERLSPAQFAAAYSKAQLFSTSPPTSPTVTTRVVARAATPPAPVAAVQLQQSRQQKQQPRASFLLPGGTRYRAARAFIPELAQQKNGAIPLGVGDVFTVVVWPQGEDQWILVDAISSRSPAAMDGTAFTRRGYVPRAFAELPDETELRLIEVVKFKNELASMLEGFAALKRRQAALAAEARRTESLGNTRRGIPMVGVRRFAPTRLQRSHDVLPVEVGQRFRALERPNSQGWVLVSPQGWTLRGAPGVGYVPQTYIDRASGEEDATGGGARWKMSALKAAEANAAVELQLATIERIVERIANGDGGVGGGRRRGGSADPMEPPPLPGTMVMSLDGGEL